MENSRDYIAFISYRHCPLDIRIAETLHRMIERYRVPRELRRDGEKSLGTVFRDRDELPLSNNLTQDIYDALDHSQFLIVVCTPDTPKSQWVEREIEYFISKHGRDRVLTVLAAGTPEESIPRRITHDYAEDGSVIAEYEPLCAYLVDPSEKNILKNLKKEFLRLIAAMLNCPYDALRQRQKRYRMQQLTALMGVVTAIALVFTLMLGNRNREISNKNQEISQKNEEISIINQQIAEQLLQAQINETNALVLLSQQQLAAGDRMGAIESALNALPHDNDGRPYSPDAEYALSQALNPYGNGKPAFHLTIEQPTDIHMMDVSDDGKYLVTLDVVGCIRCFDVDTAALLWEYQTKDTDGYDLYDQPHLLEIIEYQQTVLFSDYSCTYSLSLSTGKLLNSIQYPVYHTGGTLVSLSPDERYITLSGTKNKKACRSILDSTSLEPIFEITDIPDGNWDIISPVFTEDGTKMAYVLYTYHDPQIQLIVYDTVNWEICYDVSIVSNQSNRISGSQFELVWLTGDELILYYTEQHFNDHDSYHASIHKFDSGGNEIAFQQYQVDIYNASYFTVLGHYINRSHLYIIHPDCILIFELDTCELFTKHLFTEHDIKATYAGGQFNDLIILPADGTIRSLRGYNLTGDFGYPALNEAILMACGKKQDIEIICLVTESAPNAVSIFRSAQNSDSLHLPVPDIIQDYDQISITGVYPFPSGNLFIGFMTAKQHSTTNYKILAAIYDGYTGNIVEYFELPTDTGIITLLGVSGDEMTVIFDKFTYDLRSDTLTAIEHNDPSTQGYCSYAPPLYVQSTNRPWITVYRNYQTGETSWWADGQEMALWDMPYEVVSNYELRSYADDGAQIGGNGLISFPMYSPFANIYTAPEGHYIYSTADNHYHKIFPRSTVSGIPGVAIGNTLRNVAFADPDQVLRIYDFDSDAIVNEFPLPVSHNALFKMCYSADDQYLMCFTDQQGNSTMTVVNAQSGSIEAQLKLGFDYNRDLPPDELLQMIPEKQLLIILAPSSSDSGFIINTQSWSVIAEIPGLVFYLPGADIVIQNDFYTGAFTSSPLYSWEELAEMGWELVNTVKENKLD